MSPLGQFSFGKFSFALCSAVGIPPPGRRLLPTRYSHLLYVTML
jgi:hypothetical protein